MRSLTLTVSDETLRMARVWPAQRDRSLSSVVAELLRTLPNIQRVREAFPATLLKPNSTKIISEFQNLVPVTTDISTTSTKK
jgi:hypothetical protein